MTDTRSSPVSERLSVALEIWHRFADSNVEVWGDEAHQAEYLLCADAIIMLLRPLTEAAEVLMSDNQSLPVNGSSPGSAALAERIKTHLALRDSSPGFHLSDDDLALIAERLVSAPDAVAAEAQEQLAEIERLRAALEIIAESSDRLQALQARAALDNIGAKV